MKIFISSTCYDLIDLRAELEGLLNSLSLEPILSDSLESNFSIENGVNSIETCLANVRKSDIFLIILSQRYGPSLKNVGYDDVSATHLEYKEALSQDKPIYMYVRDRLEADYNIFKRNKKNQRLSWVKNSDIGIFNLLEEHRTLTETNKQNWFWIFSNSVELKKRVKKDLQKISGKAILDDLLNKNRLPHLNAEKGVWKTSNKGKKINLEIEISNIGNSPAIRPYLSIESENRHNLEFLETMLVNKSERIKMSIDVNEKFWSNKQKMLYAAFDYSTLEGYYIGDEYLIFLHESENNEDNSLEFEFGGKCYYHKNAFERKGNEIN